jgi:hypothetical protein
MCGRDGRTTMTLANWNRTEMVVAGMDREWSFEIVVRASRPHAVTAWLMNVRPGRPHHQGRCQLELYLNAGCRPASETDARDFGAGGRELKT